MQILHRNIFKRTHHGQPFFFPFLRQIERQRERKEIRNGRTNLIKKYIRKDKKKRTTNETKKDKSTALNYNNCANSDGGC
jgi:hypothetical protein